MPTKDITSLRAVEVIRLAALGYTTKEIAIQMGISMRTVNVYKNQLRRWFGAPTTVALVYQAVSVGLIAPLTGGDFPKPDWKCITCAYNASLRFEA